MVHAAVSVDVTEIVRTRIEAEVAAALGKDPEALIRQVVSAAMSQKANSYDRETIFQKSVTAMIRGAAQEAFKAWLDENRRIVRDAILAKINAREGLADHIADRCVDGLSSGFHISASLRVSDE